MSAEKAVHSESETLDREDVATRWMAKRKNRWTRSTVPMRGMSGRTVGAGPPARAGRGGFERGAEH